MGGSQQLGSNPGEPDLVVDRGGKSWMGCDDLDLSSGGPAQQHPECPSGESAHIRVEVLEFPLLYLLDQFFSKVLGLISVLVTELEELLFSLVDATCDL